MCTLIFAFVTLWVLACRADKTTVENVLPTQCGFTQLNNLEHISVKLFSLYFSKKPSACGIQLYFVISDGVEQYGFNHSKFKTSGMDVRCGELPFVIKIYFWKCIQVKIASLL